MSNNFFLTGLPKVGKTTMLRQLVKRLKAQGHKVGGFLSPAFKEHGTREGFYVEDISTGKRAMLAQVGAGGPRVGKYRVNVKKFESVGLSCLENYAKYDILIIDEIGRMELESEKFGDTLADVLQTDVPIVASLHRKYLQAYKIYGRVFRLTETNRGAVYVRLVNKLRSLKHRKSPSKKKPKKKRKARKKRKSRRKKSRVKKKKILKEKPKQEKKGFFDKIVSWISGE